MQVIVYTRTIREGFDGVRFVTLDELLACSDVISLHCPLTEKTQGMIDEKAISRMKQGVRVINTARGPLVNEAAMAVALESGKVACFMADVLSTEPPAQDNPLLHAKNTILTPHVAWAPYQTRVRLRDIAVGNVRAFIEGMPRNVVG
jgi:glycerate dehydrogenase